MKFAVGDIVSYIDRKRHGALRADFVERWGYGPFEIMEMHTSICVLCTLRGERVTQPDGRDWKHGYENLQLETFFDAARKAIAHDAKV